MNSMYYYETPIGILYITDNGEAIMHIGQAPVSIEFAERRTSLAQEAKRQLDEYFMGRRRRFDLPLAPTGTPFQRKVWESLLQIPYGETRTYKQLAEAVHNPNGCRAVGGANGKNPILILIPCHRVIGSGKNNLGGYTGGLDKKIQLLKIEGIL